MFEIGASLREARSRKGLDFPEIESATKIRGKYLRALEDEQFGVLPAEPYVKGFLRAYADYLGLDGQLYVDEYNSRYVPAEEEPPIRARRMVRPPRHRRLQRWVLVAALLGIAVVTAAVMLAWKSGGPSAQKVVGVSSQQPQAQTPAASVPARIILTARQATTILSVRKTDAAGKVLLENEQLKRGETRKFTTKQLWINTGTPENLRVIVNGKPIQLPGGQPQVFIVNGRGIFASA